MDLTPGTKFVWRDTEYEVLSMVYDQYAFPDAFWVRTADMDREICFGHTIRAAIDKSDRLG